MNLSWAIQAHPAREDVALALAKEIGGLVDVVFDPDPDASKSPWRTFRHLLNTTPAGATHRVQIQDDATVCNRIRDAVQLAVEARPDRLLVLFVGDNPFPHARAVHRACKRGECWATLEYSYWCPVVATVWPVALIERLNEYVEAQQWPREFRADDEIVGRFVRAIEHRPLATAPSLVEHEGVHRSLIAGRHVRGARSAACWIGNCDDCDPTEFDWQAGKHP